MNNNQLTPDDMSNLFRLFKIPKDLYNRWSTYANDTHQTMKSALAELLHTCSPGVYSHPTPDSIGWWYKSSPDYMEFSLKYTKPLQKEIFEIFKQTGCKNHTPEMNYEILERLHHALYRKQY